MTNFLFIVFKLCEWSEILFTSLNLRIEFKINLNRAWEIKIFQITILQQSSSAIK